MTDTVDLKTATAGNRLAWDASAVQHVESAEWTRLLEGFAMPGFSTLDETITAVLNELGVEDARVVQIGCNNGHELLSVMVMGAAEGLGIDQSQAFLDQAEALNELAEAPCAFLCADIYDLPEDTPRDFDIALITIGVLGWMPDITGFFDCVADLLAPGGRLVIYETHPMLEMFDPGSAAPFTPSISYFNRAPSTSAETIVYDGAARLPAPVSYWYIHGLGDIINACVASGLRIDRLDEHPHSNREAEFDIYENRDAQVPMAFTLVASRPDSDVDSDDD